MVSFQLIRPIGRKPLQKPEPMDSGECITCWTINYQRLGKGNMVNPKPCPIANKLQGYLSIDTEVQQLRQSTEDNRRKHLNLMPFENYL